MQIDCLTDIAGGFSLEAGFLELNAMGVAIL